MNKLMKTEIGLDLSEVQISFDKILSRLDSEDGKFKSLSNEALVKISSYMPEINRATNSFGKSQSQFMDLIMTVSGHSPIRNLRQILAEVERRRQALGSNIFKMKKQMIKLARKEEEYALIADDDKYKKALAAVDIEEKKAGIADSRLYIEGALKTIMSYMHAYEDIKKTFNVKENWDEKDFEEAEENYHIKKAFEQAHADVSATGRITQGNHEYLRQCGINPQNALADLLTYMEQVSADMNTIVQKEKRESELAGYKDGTIDLSKINVGIDSFIDFLDAMADKYKGASRRVLERKGINPEGHYGEALYMNKDI